MKTYEVEVTLSKQEDGLWRLEVPALPGCFVDAETLEEGTQDIQEAIQLFIRSYEKHGKPLPPSLKALKPETPHNLKIAVSTPRDTESLFANCED